MKSWVLTVCALICAIGIRSSETPQSESGVKGYGKISYQKKDKSAYNREYYEKDGYYRHSYDDRDSDKDSRKSYEKRHSYDDRDRDSSDKDSHKSYEKKHYWHDKKYDDDYKHRYYEDGKYDAKYEGEKYEKCIHSSACVAYLSAIRASEAVLLQSTNGQAPTSASQYTQDNAVTSAVFSNKARGSNCPSLDIEMSVGTDTDPTTYFTRFEAEPSTTLTTSRMYTHDTGIATPEAFPLVTRIMLKKKYELVDAYFMEFSFGFAQYDVFPLNNTQAGVSFKQSICFDLGFFKNDISRFICQGTYNQVTTAYLRDPQKGFNYLPPENNNPYTYGYGLWYTAVKLCKDTYMSSVGFEAGTGVIITRATTSLKYPYFDNIQVIYTDDSVTDDVEYAHIYSPAHSNAIYACYNTVFYRFDDAYTENTLPLTVAARSNLPAACKEIVSFKECSHEVYVVGINGALYYSNNGGDTFLSIVDAGITSVTGFLRPMRDDM